MKTYKGQIENWYICGRNLAPDGVKLPDGVYVIVGEQDGQYTRTSPIQLFTPTFVETMNSLYTLGRPGRP